MDVEVKGMLEDNGRHLELGLSREFEAGAPHVHPKKPSEYYRVNDERVLIECKKKHDTHYFPVSLSRGDSWRDSGQALRT